MSYSTKEMDHLGIVATVAKEIGLIEEIDRIVGVDERQKVTCGECVLAMTLNCLGFTQKPLYLFPKFMKNKPTEKLIRNGVKAEHFNEGTLGRALDKLYGAGPEELFMSVASHMYETYGGRFLHGDTTSFSVHGAYQPEEGDLDSTPIRITHGFSKEGRPDLKQFMVSLVTSENLPVFVKALSGNASDNNTSREIMKEYGRALQREQDHIWVWDSKFYTKKNSKAVSDNYKWISRVPMTITMAVEAGEEERLGEMEDIGNGYRLSSRVVEYGGVRQRWIVAFSEKAYERGRNRVREKVDEEKKKVEKALWHLSHREFTSRKDALKRLEALEKEWTYHRVGEVEFSEIRRKKSRRRGRPRKDEELELFYRVTADCEADVDEVERSMKKQGMFVLATNVLDEEEIGDKEVLSAYKEQQYAERGFRFLKDGLFFAHSIFLKKESRIVSMVMIMGLALLVYSVAEKKLRDALDRENETLPDQKGRPTTRPTMRWVFQLFEGIVILYNEGEFVDFLNMEQVHRNILSLLGSEFERIYEIRPPSTRKK